MSYHYPSCILESGDRVRVYAKLRANVASLAPPSSLEYIAEQRIVKGQRSLHFDCDLFTELYVEYCFVYVSQAITGAVADVRIDCVPTLPVSGEGNFPFIRTIYGTHFRCVISIECQIVQARYNSGCSHHHFPNC